MGRTTDIGRGYHRSESNDHESIDSEHSVVERENGRSHVDGTVNHTHEDTEGRIAIIGMSGRFPARATSTSSGTTSAAGSSRCGSSPTTSCWPRESRSTTSATRNYVPASPVLDDIDLFDAAFFGMSPRDAAVFDPQHRLFLECAWEAFEHAGYVGERIDGAGRRVRRVRAQRVHDVTTCWPTAQVMASVGEWLVRHTGNDMNFLATRVSYELDLRGPSMNVQTACCSSLVAVHLACQSLLNGECDMALAGGVDRLPDQTAATSTRRARSSRPTATAAPSTPRPPAR